MIGQTISHYKILEKLGEGGMGVVYRAEDLKLKRTVVLKFLPPELTRDNDAKARFIKEAQAASALQHNNICTIHEIDEIPKAGMFICMDYYPGESLDNRTARGPMPLREAVEIAKQAADGLAKSHASGIVHRDIKPANIAITEDGVVKILDFGLAKLADRTRMTRLGETLGTVAYMSPEQARGVDVDPRTDVWSLGVALYEMLTGRLPFRADHDTAVVYRILNEPHEPVTVLCPDVSEKLAGVVDKALAKNPQERYANAGEMARDLEMVARELDSGMRWPGSAKEAGKSSSASHLKIWLPIAVVLFVAAAILILKPLFFEGDVISAPRPVAVISFENQTGDVQYDYLREVIPNLLITKLEQSKYLSVVSWERMHDLLVQSGRADQTLIDKETGFEVCRLDGIDTIVLGSFTRAGDVFVTDVKVLDVKSKELLKSASATGEGIGSILANQIDELGREISRGVGLSERSIAAGGPAIANVTTRSMDAYSYFLKGREEYDNRRAADACRSLEKAIELDSTFAVAWLYLGRAHRRLRDFNTGNRAYAKAMELSASAAEKDRLYIEAVYAYVIENDEQESRRLLQRLIQKYPKEKIAHYQSGLLYSGQGQYEKAIAAFTRTLELDPQYGEALNALAYEYAALENYPKAIRYLERYADASPGSTNPLDSMAEMYFRLGDLDKATEFYKRTLDIGHNVGAETRIAYVAALQEDHAGAIEWCDRFVAAAPSPGLMGSGHLFQAFCYLLVCREDEALQSAQKARTVYQQVGHTFAVSGTWWVEGCVRYQLGQYDHARRCYAEAESIIKPANQWTPWLQAVTTFAVGLIDLKDGRVDAAREKLAKITALRADIAESDPPHSLMTADHSRLFEGEILLAEERVDDAIDMCKQRPDVVIPTLGNSDLLFYNIPVERDVLARAYVSKGALDEAISEYERLVTFDPSSKNRRLIYPVFHYRLGLLYEQKGSISEAVREYERFLDITNSVGAAPAEATDARRRLDVLRRTDR